MKILFAFANSANAYMDLEREQRSIQTAAFSGKHTLRVLPAVEISDLRAALCTEGDQQPYDIFHFSGHVTENDCLQMRGEGRKEELLHCDALKECLAKSRVRLVLLNACKSVGLATVLADVVPAAIGTNHIIRDVVARQFTRNFYQAVNELQTAKGAFEFAAQQGKQGSPAYRFVGEDVCWEIKQAERLKVVG